MAVLLIPSEKLQLQVPEILVLGIFQAFHAIKPNDRYNSPAASVRRSLALLALLKFHGSFQHLLLSLIQYL